MSEPDWHYSIHLGIDRFPGDAEANAAPLPYRHLAVGRGAK